VEIVYSDVFDSAASRSAGIVEKTVEPSELRDGEVDSLLDIRLSGNVGPDETHTGSEFGRERFTRFFRSTREDDAGALLNEQADRSFADAARPARDDRDLALHPCAHTPSLPNEATLAGTARYWRAPA